MKRLAITLLLALAVSGCTPYQTMRWQPASYIVQPGDTLYSIAFRHGLDWREVAAWNRVDPPGYLIRPGQELRLTPPIIARPAEPSQSDRPVARPAPTPAPAPAPPPRSTLDWRWPTQGELVSRFDAQTKGIGIAGRSGQAIHAAAGGRVVYTGGGLVGYGQLIIIKHDNRTLSAYAHNREILVREDEEVRAGQHIATMGETSGRRAMLHFEIRVDGQAVDPLPYLPPLGGR